MTKTYTAGTLDFSKKQVVDSDLQKQIKHLMVHLKVFHQEIEFWFSLLLKCSNPQHGLYFRKPICIELFEYAHYMQWLKNDLNEVGKKINGIFKSKDRPSPIKPLDKSVSKVINSVIKYLKEPRNKFAAHRYTEKNDKKFITIGDVNILTNKIHDKKLIDIRDQLFACEELISSWINSNKNYLIIDN
jgi:hypothetical protein